LEGFSRQEQGKDGGIAPFFLLLGTTGNGPDAGRMKETFPPDNRDYKYRNKMMKKTILAIALTCLLAIPVNAQDVMNDLLKSSTAIVNDTTKDLNDRKIAVFKVDELNYMKSKVTPDILAKFKDMNFFNQKIKMLNEQSLAMKIYCDLYLKREAECKKRNKAKVKEIFKQATEENPLFQEEDEELNNSYYNRDDYPIQFALNCDWVKVLKLIRQLDWSKY
jgi:hypothetical protein